MFKGIKRVAIVGWAKTGVALTELFLSLGKKAKVSEKKQENQFPPELISKFKNYGVQFEFGQHSKTFLTKDVDLVVVSPGVSFREFPIDIWAEQAGISVVGEIEVASWFNRAKIIGVTGTNGKSTTAFLTYLTLKKRGYRVHIGGNIGRPFSSFVLSAKPDEIVVLELSSFQLERIKYFHPFIGCVLNITPDHLDRYSDFSQYLNAKLRIFENQTPQDWAIIADNFPYLEKVKHIVSAKLKFFPSNENSNYSAICSIVSILGIEETFCKRIFQQFKGLPHRMQIVTNKSGITFINDSKATNPSSTVWALQRIKEPIILIAGGQDKGLDYNTVIPYLGRVKKVNLIGETAAKIRKIFSPYVEVEEFSSLEEAVKNAYRIAKPGMTVLLSPMCSSYDMYVNYIERGREFVKIVTQLG